MSTIIDFGAMATVPDHWDADLLADLARLNSLRDQPQLAQRRDETAYGRLDGSGCCVPKRT